MKTILFAFRVSDLDRSLAFYRAVGYTELGTVPFDDGSSLVWLKLPDEPAVSLELVHRPADGSGRDRRLRALRDRGRAR